MTVEHRSPLIEEYHRRAAEAGVWLTPIAPHRTRETISLKWNGGVFTFPLLSRIAEACDGSCAGGNACLGTL